MTSQPQRSLSASDQRQLWAKLEDIEADLGMIVAWLPDSSLRHTLERTLGSLVSAEWQVAKSLGLRKAREHAGAASPDGSGQGG